MLLLLLLFDTSSKGVAAGRLAGIAYTVGAGRTDTCKGKVWLAAAAKGASERFSRLGGGCNVLLSTTTTATSSANRGL
jgi:hypothetical protein